MNKLAEVLLYWIFYAAAMTVIVYAIKGVTGEFPPEFFFGWIGGAGFAWGWDKLTSD